MLSHIISPAWNFFHREHYNLCHYLEISSSESPSSKPSSSAGNPNMMMKRATVQEWYDKQDTHMAVFLSSSVVVEMRKRTKAVLPVRYNSRSCDKANLCLLLLWGEWYFCLTPLFLTTPRKEECSSRKGPVSVALKFTSWFVLSSVAEAGTRLNSTKISYLISSRCLGTLFQSSFSLQALEAMRSRKHKPQTSNGASAPH